MAQDIVCLLKHKTCVDREPPRQKRIQSPPTECMVNDFFVSELCMNVTVLF
jgi:hypothetical protein